jgi:hypothetical protein
MDHRFQGDVITVAVSATDLGLSLLFGKTINLNPMVWLRGFFIADRDKHSSYFWGNLVFMTLVFAGSAYWMVRLWFGW